MILKDAKAEAFLRKPTPDVRGVLLYGPDLGLIRERGAVAITAAGGDASDPFAYVELDGSALRGDPARLADEAAAIAFSSARRVVRVRGLSDAVTPAVASWLESVGDGFVVLEAGDLAKRSSLRVLMEKAKDAVAIACYVDEGADLGRVIAEHLSAAGLAVEADAQSFLEGCFGGDRGVIRSELDKLIVYAGENRRITLADVEACVGDSAAASIDAVTMATCGGDTAALDTAVRRAYGEGISPIAILRALQRHLNRLLAVQSRIGAGNTADAAMAGLRPPVFFKAKAAFRRQLQVWPEQRLSQALTLVLDAELDCKTTGLPANTICARALLALAQSARRAR